MLLENSLRLYGVNTDAKMAELRYMRDRIFLCDLLLYADGKGLRIEQDAIHIKNDILVLCHKYHPPNISPIL